MNELLETQSKTLDEFKRVIKANMLSHAYLIDQASSK
jgi:hypothetical protein